MSDEVSVSRDIAAPAEKVWAMVADVTRMPEWSPENTGCTWRGGATGPTTGAKFRGSNRVGKRSWKTDAVVTASRRFTASSSSAISMSANARRVGRFTRPLKSVTMPLANRFRGPERSERPGAGRGG